MAIDLGAIAKGYAADEAVAVLRANGVESAFVNLGGNVYVIGAKPDNSPWRIGIRDPFAQEANSFVGVISATDTSVVTSGTYERYFVKDGVTYHHILDPKTGYPAESDLASVTIISPESIVADAVSTSTFLIGKEAGKALIESLPNVEAVLVDKDRNVWVSSGIRNQFEIAEGFALDETR
jgi:thiamine biosynthesis lipoprotein